MMFFRTYVGGCSQVFLLLVVVVTFISYLAADRTDEYFQ